MKSGRRKGATHFTHWFQPLAGIAGDSYDSSETAFDVLLGKKRVAGRATDASTLGGLRATFESMVTVGIPAQPSSGEVLCIPTALFHTPEKLTDKPPLASFPGCLENKPSVLASLDRVDKH